MKKGKKESNWVINEFNYQKKILLHIIHRYYERVQAKYLNVNVGFIQNDIPMHIYAAWK